MARDRALTRRAFTAGLAAPALIGLSCKAGRRIAGGFVFESQERGHRIRDHARFAAPKRTEPWPL